jgi:uncharacterized protein
MSRVLVTGATGTIGRALIGALQHAGHQVMALSRDSERARALLGERVEARGWREPTTQPPPREALATADAVVHLLGEPVAQRWSATAKRAIRESRVLSTQQLVGAIRKLDADSRPRVLVCQSAAGYYGAHGEEAIDEGAPPGTDFLAQVVVEWEQEAGSAEDVLRVVKTRTGVVLSPSGGALGTMLPVFRLGLGGPIGGGRQYVPWIHLDDVVQATLRCLEDPDLSGPVNLTAPTPVTNHDFTKALGRALGRPTVLPIPSLALRLLYGEMAGVITTGARVLPARLQQAGHQFIHQEIEAALRDVLAKSR